MKLVGFVIRELAIPFRLEIRHALASRARTSSVVFEIITDRNIRGYGEGAPRPYVTGETLHATLSTLQRVAEKMKNLELYPTDNVIEKITGLHHDFRNEFDRSPSAQCAVEVALLDVYGKLLSLPVLDILGERRTTDIYYSGVVPEGISDEALQTMSALQFHQVKIKAGRDGQADFERLQRVQSFLGDDVQIRIDANGAWRFEETIERLERFSAMGVHLFEQPMPVSDKDKYPLLMDRIDDTIKILVDESICTYDDALWFIQNNGASGFNLKISKHGGLLAALSIHRLATENGLVNQLGCHVGETSILTAAGVTFAAMAENLSAHEGAYGRFLLEKDIARHPIQFGMFGKYDLENLVVRPGFGLQIDSSVLLSNSRENEAPNEKHACK